MKKNGKFAGERYFSLGEYVGAFKVGVKISDVQLTEINALALKITKENGLEVKRRPGSGTRSGAGNVFIYRESILESAIDQIVHNI